MQITINKFNKAAHLAALFFYMERGKIKLSEDEVFNIAYEGAHWTEDDDGETEIYKTVDRKVTYTDMEKSYYREDIVFQRLEDDKYFKINVIKSPWVDLKSQTAIEVFPKKITTIVYE